jgi:glycosyltransferase involved in cell wall biosynthesis
LLVPPGEVSTLAAALEELLNDAPRANQMGLAARARLERGSSWQLVAERMSAALHG